MTHLNAPEQAAFGPPVVANRLARARPVLGSADVRYYGEPIALVVADEFEQARAAPRWCRRAMIARHRRLSCGTISGRRTDPRVGSGGNPPDSAVGDFARGFANAPVKIDATYENGYQHHNPMEPHAALAQWDGDTLTAYVSQQQLANARTALAATLRIPPENVRLISRYIGGGFGSKLPINTEIVLASLAARRLDAR